MASNHTLFYQLAKGQLSNFGVNPQSVRAVDLNSSSVLRNASNVAAVFYMVNVQYEATLVSTPCEVSETWPLPYDALTQLSHPPGMGTYLHACRRYRYLLIP